LARCDIRFCAGFAEFVTLDTGVCTDVVGESRVAFGTILSACGLAFFATVGTFLRCHVSRDELIKGINFLVGEISIWKLVFIITSIQLFDEVESIITALTIRIRRSSASLTL